MCVKFTRKKYKTNISCQGAFGASHGLQSQGVVKDLNFGRAALDTNGKLASNVECE